LESLSIGVRESESNVDARQGLINLPQTSNDPLKDESLFGNDSDCSEFDEISKEETIAMKEIGTFCVLSGDNLVCKVKGNTNVFCLRLLENDDIKIILSITSTLQEIHKKVKIEENDILLVIAAKIKEEKVLELVKRLVEKKNPREVPIRNYSKKIAEYLEKETNTMVIAARILKGI